MVDEDDRERDVEQMRGRRLRAFGAIAVAAMVLIGTAGCGGGGSTGSDNAATTTKASGSDKGDDKAPGLASLPDPCDLVPLDEASEILGGEAAKPEATSSDTTVATKTCVWQTQAGKDNPTLDGAGHLLTLTVIAAPEGMGMLDFWESAAADADEEVEIPRCSEGFRTGGILSGSVDGVYLTGSAGAADTSADAQQSVLQLVSAACEGVTS